MYMEFPIEIVAHINAYAKPVTRADWRHLHKYTPSQFREDLIQAYYRTFVCDYGYYYANEHDVVRPRQYRLLKRVLIE